MPTLPIAKEMCDQLIKGGRKYVKTSKTLAVKVDFPFSVQTKEGIMECPDGYLAKDSEGNYYPIASSVFDATYRLANERKKKGGKTE